MKIDKRSRARAKREGIGKTQISARISAETKQRLESFIRARGLKQNYIVEQALQDFMRAAAALPEDARIPASIVFSNQSFEEIVRAIQSPARPTPDLVKLMKGQPISEDGLH